MMNSGLLSLWRKFKSCFGSIATTPTSSLPFEDSNTNVNMPNRCEERTVLSQQENKWADPKADPTLSTSSPPAADSVQQQGSEGVANPVSTIEGASSCIHLRLNQQVESEGPSQTLPDPSASPQNAALKTVMNNNKHDGDMVHITTVIDQDSQIDLLDLNSSAYENQRSDNFSALLAPAEGKEDLGHASTGISSNKQPPFAQSTASEFSSSCLSLTGSYMPRPAFSPNSSWTPRPTLSTSSSSSGLMIWPPLYLAGPTSARPSIMSSHHSHSSPSTQPPSLPPHTVQDAPPPSVITADRLQKQSSRAVGVSHQFRTGLRTPFGISGRQRSLPPLASPQGGPLPDAVSSVVGTVYNAIMEPSNEGYEFSAPLSRADSTPYSTRPGSAGAFISTSRTLSVLNVARPRRRESSPGALCLPRPKPDEASPSFDASTLLPPPLNMAALREREHSLNMMGLLKMTSGDLALFDTGGAALPGRGGRDLDFSGADALGEGGNLTTPAIDDRGSFGFRAADSRFFQHMEPEPTAGTSTATLDSQGRCRPSPLMLVTDQLPETLSSFQQQSMSIRDGRSTSHFEDHRLLIDSYPAALNNNTAQAEVRVEARPGSDGTGSQSSGSVSQHSALLGFGHSSGSVSTNQGEGFGSTLIHSQYDDLLHVIPGASVNNNAPVDTPNHGGDRVQTRATGHASNTVPSSMSACSRTETEDVPSIGATGSQAITLFDLGSSSVEGPLLQGRDRCAATGSFDMSGASAATRGAAASANTSGVRVDQGAVRHAVERRSSGITENYAKSSSLSITLLRTVVSKEGTDDHDDHDSFVDDHANAAADNSTSSAAAGPGHPRSTRNRNHNAVLATDEMMQGESAGGVRVDAPGITSTAAAVQLMVGVLGPDGGGGGGSVGQQVAEERSSSASSDDSRLLILS